MSTEPRRTKFGVLIDEWQAVRAQLAAIEAAEHPDIVDEYGRTWTWRDGDLYVHHGFAFPERWVRAGVGRPSKVLPDNPNYDLCDICKGILR